MITKELLVPIFSEKSVLLNMPILWDRCQQRLNYAIKRLTPEHFSLVLGLFIFTAALPVFAQQISIWNKTAIPANLDEADANAVELGVQFRTTESGFITSILFFRGPGNNGLHTGTLWSNTGELLATVDFTNETVEDGWQQADFASPVPVFAGQTYTASYYAPFGNYSLDQGFFANTGVANGPLKLLQDGINGGNGVYVYSPISAFPSESYNASNYWVDVIFSAAGSYTLGDLSCNEGQVAKFNGSAWECGNEVQGPAGADGAKGDNGDTGPAGINGTPGQQGPAGVDGAAGVTGPQGIQGPAGINADPAQINALQAQIAALQAQIDTLPVFYKIGDTGPGGGIVFHIINGGINGLEAAPEDQADRKWCDTLTDLSIPNLRTNAGIPATVGDGSSNTNSIVDECIDTYKAAKTASVYQWPSGVTDGFLPSIGELGLMRMNLHLAGLGGFTNDNYWSSTEYDSEVAWFQYFPGGGQGIKNKDEVLKVRAVRNF